MPYKRKITYENSDGEKTVNHIYYINRKIPGLGPEPVHKTLETSRKRTAQRREDTLLRLAEKGELEIVQGFLNDRLSIQTIQAEVDNNRLDRLHALLSRPEETLADAIDDALEVKRGEVDSQKTLDGYRRKLEDFATWLETDVLEVDEEERDPERPGDAINVRRAFEDNRPKKYLGYRRHDLERAPNTVNNDQIGLSVLARHCVERAWIAEMPDFDWEKRPVRIRWLTPSQVRRYLNEFKGELRLLMALIVATGLRLGEALGLVRGDIRLEEEGRCMIGDAKTTSGVRPAFVPGWVVPGLTRHLKERDLDPEDPLFTTPIRTVQKRHRKVREKLDISGRRKVIGDEGKLEEGNPNYTIHDHRHTAAVALARSGMPLHLLKRQLGHDSIETTRRYAEFHPDYTDVDPFYNRVADTWGVDSFFAAAGDREQTAEEAAA